MSAPIPQGIEVLVNKAAVDPEFRVLLLENAIAAANAIGLELRPAEAAMLGVIPRAQLEAIIARTHVPEEHRRAFLGQAAAAMLAAMGMMVTHVVQAGGLGGGGGAGSGFGGPPAPSAGVRAPDSPPMKSDDMPKERTTEERVIGVVARQFKKNAKDITGETSFTKDLKATNTGLVALRKAFEKEFKIDFPLTTFKKADTVGGVVGYIDGALAKQAQPKPPATPPVTKGIRPDRPPAGGLGGQRPD